MSGQDLRLGRCDLTFPHNGFHIPHHDSKGLLRALLSIPQPRHSIFIRGITAEMESSDALDGGDSPRQDRFPGLCDRPSAAICFPEQIDLRATVRTADGLCVIPPCGGIIVFFRTVGTHGKFLHGRPFPVVGKGIQDRQPGTAAGTVDKRMQIPAVRGIVHL